MIQAEQLGFRTAGKDLLSAVSFELNSGEILAVLGPNGAGKSTLLKCLAGQLHPTTGAIRVGADLLSSFRAQDVARWRGVLPQASHIPFEFRVIEIVMLGRSPHSRGGTSARDHAIAMDALALADATHLVERSVQTLSGGELQRVHLARVLAQIWDPVDTPGRLLLLDEPTASLDLKHQHALLKIARSWAENRSAVMVILHDMNLAAAHADRILFLKDGRMVSVGTPKDVITSARIQQVFDVQSVVLEHPRSGVPVVIVDDPDASCNRRF